MCLRTIPLSLCAEIIVGREGHSVAFAFPEWPNFQGGSLPTEGD
jgi:hypothetical protein